MILKNNDKHTNKQEQIREKTKPQRFAKYRIKEQSDVLHDPELKKTQQQQQ